MILFVSSTIFGDFPCSWGPPTVKFDGRQRVESEKGEEERAKEEKEEEKEEAEEEKEEDEEVSKGKREE